MTFKLGSATWLLTFSFLFACVGCSLTVPDHLDGWGVAVYHSPFSMNELEGALECLAEEWEGRKNVGVDRLRQSARGATVKWVYDVSGKRHLPGTTKHGNFTATNLGDLDITLAYGDDDTIFSSSWDHEWSHLFLFQIFGDLDPNHLGRGGPWDEDVQYMAEQLDCSSGSRP